MENLLAIQELLKEQRQRWDWELQQAENTRLQGDESHFLRAKAGFRCTQEAQRLLAVVIGNRTGWEGFFPDNTQPLQLCSVCSGYIGHADDDRGCRCQRAA